MVENEGVDAIKIAGASWEPLHLSCCTKLHKAITLKIMAIRRDRWFVQANERQQQVTLSGSTRNQRSGAGAWVKTAPASEKKHDAGPTLWKGSTQRERTREQRANTTAWAVKAAETNKMRDYKPPPSTQALHIISMAFDIHGRWGEKAELALKKAVRRKLEKT